MSFTDRFIKVPVDLYDNKKADLIGYSEETREMPTFCKVNPFEIAYYRPAVDDNDQLTQTVIHFKNGESFYTTLNVDQFENLLNKHNA